VEARVKLSGPLSWLGLVASGVLLVNLNVAGSRWYKRWDLTTDKLYTLSGPTLDLLHGLSRPVDVNVLLSKTDPLEVSVRHMLDAYGAETQQLRVHYVDPDRSPAEFLAVQQKYQILAGKADDGRVITDAVIVIADGNQHWFVTSEELVHLDEDSGRSRPALEQALSSALDNVRRTEKAKVCFTTGHREPTLDDAGPQGLSELRQRLLKNNFEAENIDASAPNANFSSCATVVVPTPELEFSTEQAARLRDYVKSGGSALLLLGPTTGDTQTLRGTGLDSVLELSGVSLGRDVVIEQDKGQRLPQGQGELFWAKLKPHAVTRGVLHDDDKLSSRVLVVQSRSLTTSGAAVPLLESSDQAAALRDLAALSGDGSAETAIAGATHQAFALAAATELPATDAGKKAHGARVFVTGASNLAWNRNFQDPSLYGNRRLIENAISWTTARPSLLSVPEKPEREVGISLSEESLGEVMRYVLFYMPLSSGLIAAFVLLRRRNVERRSRQGSRPTGESAS
jgi:hypothetical protein